MFPDITDAKMSFTQDQETGKEQKSSEKKKWCTGLSGYIEMCVHACVLLKGNIARYCCFIVCFVLGVGAGSK